MRAHNICPSTWVLDHEYGNLGNVTYASHEWKDDEGNDCRAKFVTSRKGVVTHLLEDLTAMRKVSHVANHVAKTIPIRISACLVYYHALICESDRGLFVFCSGRKLTWPRRQTQSPKLCGMPNNLLIGCKALSHSQPFHTLQFQSLYIWQAMLLPSPASSPLFLCSIKTA
jgi:hypothetical protein